MTQRVVGGQTFNLGYDPENHMVSVSGAAAAAYTYTGDGQRIVATEGVTTTVYLGNYLEWAKNINTQAVTSKSYYYAGATRVAMRQDGGAPLWLFGDHLGSTSVVANYDGSAHGKQLYQAWGETRFASGDIPTSFQYTGQSRQASIGLDYFNARWFDPVLGRFTQADIIVPEASRGVLAWDRYAFVLNNPLNHVDPSGHIPECADVEDPACDPATSDITPTEFWEQEAAKYNITFEGKWSVWAMRAVVMAAMAVGAAFARIIGGDAAEAFIWVFRSMVFVWGTKKAGLSAECKNITGGGCTSSSHLINFVSLSEPGGNRSMNMAFINARNNVVHELGHAFASVMRNKETEVYNTLRGSSVFNGNGFHPSPNSARRTWRQNPTNSPGEIFADSFLGWVFDTWGANSAGAARDEFMTTNMADWLSQLRWNHDHYSNPITST